MNRCKCGAGIKLRTSCYQRDVLSDRVVRHNQCQM